MEDMKKCTQCGTELPSDALFCPECGTRQSAAAVSDPSAIASSNGSDASYDPFMTQAQTAASIQPSILQSVQPPVQQQNMQNTTIPPGGMNPAGMQPGFPRQDVPGKVNPVITPISNGKKMPVFAIVVIALMAIGLLYWFFRFFNPNLDPYSFGDLRSNAMVFAFLLMTIAAVCSTIILRVQMRGSKLSILANILLVLVVFVMLYGISIAEFSDKNLFYKLFMNFTK